MWKFLFSLLHGKMKSHCPLVSEEKLAMVFDRFRPIHKFDQFQDSPRITKALAGTK